ncbi:MAG: glucosaminidase domain-containing protein [Bacteroidetes bacterium]|nr:glucosaminidase domain-containing protein [Bacteroidota bacterium]
MRKFLLAALFFPLLISAQRRMTTAEYIEMYKENAMTEMRKHGIPASITLAQGILESSSGNSDLATEARNHFGIKCKKEWTGPAFYKDDDEKNECFRKYESVLASYEDHSLFLKNSQRYASLFLLSQDDYKGWAHGLKKAGYATNPRYAELLIKTVEENTLFKYDTEVLSGRPATVVVEKKTEITEAPEISVFTEKERVVRSRNRVKYVLAHDGDTPEKLTRELDLLSWQITKYNDLDSKSYAFKPGEVVYIQPKRKKAEEKSATVKPGQSLRDISQEYAVKISSLIKLNQLSENSVLTEGQVIKLR